VDNKSGGKKMRKLALLLALILIIPMFSQIRSSHAISFGYEEYRDDKCEIYLEYLPIVPTDPTYPTASEEFAIKYDILQKDWWEGMYHYFPWAWIISVHFRDDTCGNNGWTEWKKWYPEEVNQNGLDITLGASIGGPITMSATIQVKDAVFETNNTKWEENYNGKIYMHVGSLVAQYNSNPSWGSAYTEGVGLLGIPNHLGATHISHHVEIFVDVLVVWMAVVYIPPAIIPIIDMRSNLVLFCAWR
jgi:hypothetical protein